MGHYQDTVSAEQVALKLTENSSEEAKRFFKSNYDFRDAESLDDVLCFIGYRSISLKARHASAGELEELARQANIFRPLLENGNKVEAELVELIEDFLQGKSHRILRFVDCGDNASSPSKENIRIDKQSAYLWAKEKLSVEIPEWAPSVGPKESDIACLTEYSDEGDSSDRGTSPRKSGATKDDTEDADATILLRTMAWFLDTFMEFMVRDWKDVMRDKERIRGNKWFRKNKLNISTVIEAITPEFEGDPLSRSKIHIHVREALRVIQNNWTIVEPLKPREKRKAYLTLKALRRAAVRALSSSTDKVSEFDVLMKNPTKYLKLLSQANAIPSCLTQQQIASCLKKF